MSIYKWHATGMAILEFQDGAPDGPVQPVFFASQDAARAWLESKIQCPLTADDLDRFFAGAGIRAHPGGARTFACRVETGLDAS